MGIGTTLQPSAGAGSGMLAPGSLVHCSEYSENSQAGSQRTVCPAGVVMEPSPWTTEPSGTSQT